MVRGGSVRDSPPKPGPDYLLCVVEVADSSLRYDQGTKLRLYARHAIPVYIIIDLIHRVAEVYSMPDRASSTYTSMSKSLPEDWLVIPTGAEPLRVRVADLLP